MFQSSSRQGPAGVPPTGTEVAKFGTYAEAQRAVDFLADRSFPVNYVTIVGSDLISVEWVITKLSYGKVAGAGLASGAWMGLFVGLVFGLFAPPGQFFRALLPAVAIGAGFGMLFAVVSYAMSRGQRDFASTSQVMARTYTILANPQVASDAARLLSEMPGVVQPHPSWEQPPAPPAAPVAPAAEPPAQELPAELPPDDPLRTNPYREPDL
jgi:hypothetical protein